MALVTANLPFVNERIMAVIAWRGRTKTLAMRLGELLVLYGATGAFGLWLERRAGQIAMQGWEFYTVTGAMFIVLAFPGFTWRYLLKHRRPSHGD
jgi:hypothetical protein